MKFLSVVGARPELIQAMPVSQALRARHEEVLVHIGQPSDYRMAQIFFDELALPTPRYTVALEAGTQAQQLIQLLTQLEPLLLAEKPDVVIVRGDSNSTLGVALLASKLQIPLAHIEAGERSSQHITPAASNRVMIDTLADYHFCSTQKAADQLAHAGKANRTYWIGDVMLDALRQVLPRASTRVPLLANLGVTAGAYGLVTLHHPVNVDNPQRLRQILQTLNRLQEPIIFPIHPRTRRAIATLGLPLAAHIQHIEPLGYLDMLMLAANARIIATDSSGLQREAFYLLTPCLTLRDATEWTETVETGWNYIVDADPQQIIERWHNFPLPAMPPDLFGDGTAAQRIVAILEEMLGE